MIKLFKAKVPENAIAPALTPAPGAMGRASGALKACMKLTKNREAVVADILKNKDEAWMTVEGLSKSKEDLVEKAVCLLASQLLQGIQVQPTAVGEDEAFNYSGSFDLPAAWGGLNIKDMALMRDSLNFLAEVYMH